MRNQWTLAIFVFHGLVVTNDFFLRAMPHLRGGRRLYSFQQRLEVDPGALGLHAEVIQMVIRGVAVVVDTVLEHDLEGSLISPPSLTEGVEDGPGLRLLLPRGVL